jgi:hypothetical protein
MKMLSRTFIMLIVCTESLSCTHQIPVSRVNPENNKTYKVDFLFEHDGCKVYRFLDRGNYVYFTNCNGEVISNASDSTQIRSTNSIKNDPKK